MRKIAVGILAIAVLAVSLVPVFAQEAQPCFELPEAISVVEKAMGEKYADVPLSTPIDIVYPDEITMIHLCKELQTP